MYVSPRDLRRLLRRLGLPDLKAEEVKSVDRVVMFMRDGSAIEISGPTVMRFEVANVVVYQVQASRESIKEVRAVEASSKPSEIEITDEDVELVIRETGCSREEAMSALREAGGSIVDAIMIIRRRRGQS